MKNAIANVLLTVGFAALLGTTPARCQSSMRFEIPFTFLAAGHAHAAGVYEVSMNTDLRYLLVRPVNSTVGELVMLNGGSVRRAAKSSTAGFLQFQKCGNTYALRAVGAPGISDGLGVVPSKAEEELAKAAGGGAGEIVTIR